MKKKSIIISIVIIVVVIAIFNSDNIYKGYIHLFNKSAVIGDRNEKGQYDGEVTGYVNGKPDYSAFYKDGLIEGWAKQYFNNGQLKGEIFYKNGKANGSGIGFYENGVLSYKVLWKNNLHIESAFYYLQNAKLFSYDSFDVRRNSIIFSCEYNSSGKLKSKLGSVFSNDIYTKVNHADSAIILENNETYDHIKDLYVTVATPPGFTPQIAIKINDRKYCNLNVKAHTVITRNAFPATGIFNITIWGKLISPDGKILKADTLNKLITVN